MRLYTQADADGMMGADLVFVSFDRRSRFSREEEKKTPFCQSLLMHVRLFGTDADLSFLFFFSRRSTGRLASVGFPVYQPPSYVGAFVTLTWHG